MKIIIKNKEYNLSNVETFVHELYGNNWEHIWSVASHEGDFRTFEDKFMNQITILYKKNSNNMFIPFEITKIKIV